MHITYLHSKCTKPPKRLTYIASTFTHTRTHTIYRTDGSANHIYIHLISFTCCVRVCKKMRTKKANEEWKTWDTRDELRKTLSRIIHCRAETWRYETCMGAQKRMLFNLKKLTEYNRMQITLVNLLSDWQLVNFINSTIYFAISYHITSHHLPNIASSQLSSPPLSHASTHTYTWVWVWVWVCAPWVY